MQHYRRTQKTTTKSMQKSHGLLGPSDIKVLGILVIKYNTVEAQQQIKEMNKPEAELKCRAKGN